MLALYARRNNMSSFSREHWSTILATIGALIGALASIGQNYLENKEKEESLVYERQLASLNEIEGSIDALREFVKNQKEDLKMSQVAVDKLKEEQQKLKPVVEADRKVIDALFKIQAEQQQKNIWLDRAFGFFIGIASSLVASLFWAYIRRKRV